MPRLDLLEFGFKLALDDRSIEGGLGTQPISIDEFETAALCSRV